MCESKHQESYVFRIQISSLRRHRARIGQIYQRFHSNGIQIFISNLFAWQAEIQHKSRLETKSISQHLHPKPCGGSGSACPGVPCWDGLENSYKPIATRSPSTAALLLTLAWHVPSIYSWISIADIHPPPFLWFNPFNPSYSHSLRPCSSLSPLHCFPQRFSPLNKLTWLLK